MVPPRLIRRALYRLARVPEPADPAGALRALGEVLDRIRQRRTSSRGNR